MNSNVALASLPLILSKRPITLNFEHVSKQKDLELSKISSSINSKAIKIKSNLSQMPLVVLEKIKRKTFKKKK